MKVHQDMVQNSGQYRLHLAPPTVLPTPANLWDGNENHPYWLKIQAMQKYAEDIFNLARTHDFDTWVGN